MERLKDPYSKCSFPWLVLQTITSISSADSAQQPEPHPRPPCCLLEPELKKIKRRKEAPGNRCFCSLGGNLSCAPANRCLLPRRFKLNLVSTATLSSLQILNSSICFSHLVIKHLLVPCQVLFLCHTGVEK